ncbi:MAG TPA: hypothetical protein P5205_08345 [Candidatus Paceibacterota bacterium]|nr:hypothetical protein [Verrucomicrobiota bacterium]HSA10367.1 hypothetical protein [Candidatus Paceibacterota bacterium]
MTINQFRKELATKYNVWKKNKATSPIEDAREVQSEYDKKKHEEYLERAEATNKELLAKIASNEKQIAELKKQSDKAPVKVWPVTRDTKPVATKERFIIENRTPKQVTEAEFIAAFKARGFDASVQHPSDQFSKTTAYKFPKHGYCLMFENGKAYYQTDKMETATLLVKNGPGSAGMVRNNLNKNEEALHLTKDDFTSLVKANVSAEELFKSYQQLKAPDKVKLNSNAATAVW